MSSFDETGEFSMTDPCAGQPNAKKRKRKQGVISDGDYALSSEGNVFFIEQCTNIAAI